jgi:hypothetical protein
VRAWRAWKRDAQGAPALAPHERPSAGCRFFGWLCKGDDADAPARIRHVLDSGVPNPNPESEPEPEPEPEP